MEINEFAESFLQDVYAESDVGGDFLEDTFFQKACVHLIDAGELDDAERVPFKTPRGIRVDGFGGDPTDLSDVLSLIILDFHTSKDVGRLTRNSPLNNAMRNIVFLKGEWSAFCRC